MTNIPKVGVAVAIRKNEKILLGKRKNSHGDGTWAFPGGHLEFNETWEECAIREVEEEVGIKIKNIQFGTATNDIFEEEKKHYITLVMIADYDSGEVKVLEPDKCENWEWFIWKDLPNPLFHPIKELIKKGYSPITS